MRWQTAYTAVLSTNNSFHYYAPIYDDWESNLSYDEMLNNSFTTELKAFAGADGYLGAASQLHDMAAMSVDKSRLFKLTLTASGAYNRRSLWTPTARRLIWPAAFASLSRRWVTSRLPATLSGRWPPGNKSRARPGRVQRWRWMEGRTR